MRQSEKLIHTFSPVYDQQSKVLILGTFPSVKSREQNFYYGHPQNRFWKLLAALTKAPVPTSIEEKKAFLLEHRIAIWDVIASCEIVGSSDSSIKDVVPNDVAGLLGKTNIKAVFANGAKAYDLYQKYIYKSCGVDCWKLPSTSPANAAWNMERLCQDWTRILEA